MIIRASSLLLFMLFITASCSEADDGAPGVSFDAGGGDNGVSSSGGPGVNDALADVDRDSDGDVMPSSDVEASDSQVAPAPSDGEDGGASNTGPSDVAGDTDPEDALPPDAATSDGTSDVADDQGDSSPDDVSDEPGDADEPAPAPADSLDGGGLDTADDEDGQSAGGAGPLPDVDDSQQDTGDGASDAASDPTSDAGSDDSADLSDGSDAEEPPLVIDETTCEGAAQAFTSAGCLFAPFVGNPSSTAHKGPLPWAVIAANTNALPTDVSLYDPSGTLIESATIAGGALHIFELDGDGSAVWEHPEASGIFDLAMRLESSAPIVAYQFQPYSSSFSATADATLLLPKHAWGTNHLVLSIKGSGPMWVTVLSLDDDVDMRIRMPEAMIGATAAGGGIPALSAGDIHLLSLNAGQTARFLATGNTDLSGMRIFSGDGKVAVFAGSPGTSLPGPGFAGYNDYLEEQLPPRTAWGMDVAAVKFQPRGDEVDVYRIMADKNNTTVNVEGDIIDTYVLDEGEFVQFTTDGDFRATASEAILVAHGMVASSLVGGVADPDMWPGNFVSSNCGGGVASASDMGDPALSFLTPTEQFRNDYVFLTPYTYGWDVLTLVAPLWTWGDVLLDGEPLPDPELHPGDSELGYARMLVADGAHQVTSPFAGVGIEVYGYDCRLSYAYSGGLSLGAINEPPPDPDAEQ